MSEMAVKVWPLSLERVDIAAGGDYVWVAVTVMVEKVCVLVSQVLSLSPVLSRAKRDDKKSKAAEQEATTPVFLLTTSKS